MSSPYNLEALNAISKATHCIQLNKTTKVEKSIYLISLRCVTNTQLIIDI